MLLCKTFRDVEGVMNIWALRAEGDRFWRRVYMTLLAEDQGQTGNAR